MATLRRFQAISVRYSMRTWASHWLCVILGAYFAVQLVAPAASIG